jgi:hypothetical protein
MESCYHIRKSKGKTEGTLNFQSSNQVDCDVIRESGGYDQMKCREIISKMIIAHELPFLFVEISCFKQDCPGYPMHSNNNSDFRV